MNTPQQYQMPDLLAGVPPIPRVLRGDNPDIRSPHDIAIRAHGNATYKDVKKPVEERAAQYMFENPDVYHKFVKFTWELLRAGKTRIGAKMIAERMRWESLISGKDGFKINNSYIAFMARRFMKENPYYENLFETRERAVA